MPHGSGPRFFTKEDDAFKVARVRISACESVGVYVYDAPGEPPHLGTQTVSMGAGLACLDEFCGFMTPAQADELGRELIRAAKIARGEEPRPPREPRGPQSPAPRPTLKLVE